MGAVAAVAVATAGCGGHSGSDRDAKARTGIPQVDRTAFVQLASATALLRASAAGSPRRSELRAARARLAALRPRNPVLRNLRSRLSAAADALLSSPVRGRRVSLGAVRAVTAGLRRYAKKHPGVAGLVPD